MCVIQSLVPEFVWTEVLYIYKANYSQCVISINIVKNKVQKTNKWAN